MGTETDTVGRPEDVVSTPRANGPPAQPASWRDAAGEAATPAGRVRSVLRLPAPPCHTGQSGAAGGEQADQARRAEPAEDGAFTVTSAFAVAAFAILACASMSACSTVYVAVHDTDTPGAGGMRVSAGSRGAWVAPASVSAGCRGPVVTARTAPSHERATERPRQPAVWAPAAGDWFDEPF